MAARSLGRTQNLHLFDLFLNGPEYEAHTRLFIRLQDVALAHMDSVWLE
jgi:hypothetical protein